MVEGSYLAPVHERNTLRMNLCVIECPMGVIIDVMMSSCGPLLFSAEIISFSSSGKLSGKVVAVWLRNNVHEIEGLF